MKKLTLVVILALSLQFSLPATYKSVAQTRNAAKAAVDTSGPYAAEIKQFDEFAARQMAFDKTPGLTIGFMKDDFVWVKGYGYADIENKAPAKPESAYRLASVTKSMTAVAIMQLVEKKKIDLDAEVQTYVPYFPKKQWPVTVRQLLGHLGGISHYKNLANELHIKEPKTTRQSIAIFEGFDLVAEPGTRYSYTSYGYNLLGAIVEAASGMSFGDYMRQHVWAPLGMNDTRMDDPTDVIPNRVRGYRLVNGEVRNSEFVDISSRFAAGGTRSTVPDLLKYARGFINGKLLSTESMVVTVTSMTTREGRLTNYGMGWDTTPFAGRYMLAHSGGQQETATLLYLLPSRNMALAIGMNFESGNPGVYLDRLFHLVTGTPRNLPFYSSDRDKAALAEGINAVFNYGLGYFERQRKPFTTDRHELAQAFVYFNTHVNLEALKSNSQETTKKIREGVHPLAQQAFTKVGSYMAARLAEKHGAAKLDAYASLGGFAFVEDYLALIRSEASTPKELQLNDGLAQAATELARDWRKSNTDFVRTLSRMTVSDLDVVDRNLRQAFAGANLYPNYVDTLFGFTREFVLRRDLAKAVKAGRLAFELYPEAPQANFTYGLALVLSGDAAGGHERLRKAVSLNPNGAGSAGGLNNVAFSLAGGGMIDEAMTILKVAIELHPKEANLYDSLGEFQLRKGDKAKALESYKKALEINPNFPNAAAARDLVKRLSGDLGQQ